MTYRAESRADVAIAGGVKRTTTAWGEKRTRQVVLKAGHTVEDVKGTHVLDEDCYVDVEETWTWDPRYPSLRIDGEWREPQYKWDTLRPVTSSTSEPAQPAVVKLSWWRRLFGLRIPCARVVQR